MSSTLSPTVTDETGSAARRTAQAVRLAWLAAPADASVDELALMALDALEERDANRSVLLAALELLHLVAGELEQQTRIIRALQRDRQQPEAAA